jgi:hypothetical protein
MNIFFFLNDEKLNLFFLEEYYWKHGIFFFGLNRQKYLIVA